MGFYKGGGCEGIIVNKVGLVRCCRSACVEGLTVFSLIKGFLCLCVCRKMTRHVYIQNRTAPNKYSRRGSFNGSKGVRWGRRLGSNLCSLESKGFVAPFTLKYINSAFLVWQCTTVSVNLY